MNKKEGFSLVLAAALASEALHVDALPADQAPHIESDPAPAPVRLFYAPAQVTSTASVPISFGPFIQPRST